MISSQFEIVQDALQARPFDRTKLTGPHLRLTDAWTSTTPGTQIWGDILGHLGHVLRHERLTGAESDPFLEADFVGRGIDLSKTELFGLRITPMANSLVRVKLGTEWLPNWLNGQRMWLDHAIASPNELRWQTARPITTKARVSNDDPIAVDPAVSWIAPQMTHYRSKAQAIALRSVAFAAAGTTVHVVLPTGSGKSLVGIAPGLIDPAATTVVIVPTIALALDQEIQARRNYANANLPAELAYHGGRPTADKRAIRERLRTGAQRLLFASPESFVQSLAEPLRDLARRGGLTYIVIDEAHLVYSWGTDFRPEFQLAASLISELRILAQDKSMVEPKTVLMTATLSAEALRLNEALFSDGRSIFVGTSYLRTELRYLDAQSDESDRQVRLLELMRHCPKPAIVYTTRRQDAEDLVAALRSNGFGRCAAFHGKVSDAQREAVLNGWSSYSEKTSIDTVVGTSAFGLGVDQSDVRTIAHACIPRSVDRFYQEVGRAGRDGHTSISVWLPSPARDFANSRVELTRLIGHEKAWNRWIAMRDSPAEVAASSSGNIVVDLRRIPIHNNADNEQNRLWNRNILTILRRAGVITFTSPLAPEGNKFISESDEEWEKRLAAEWEIYRNTLEISYAGDAGSLDEPAFEAAFQLVKREVKQREDESFERIRQLLASHICWGEHFADEYSLHVPEIAGVDYVLSPSCSGCPACSGKKSGLEPPVVALRPTPAVPRLNLVLMPALREEFFGREILLVTYDPALRRQQSAGVSRFRRMVGAAVTNGIRQVLYSRALDPSTIEEIRIGVGHSPLVVLEEADLQVSRRALDYPTLLIAAVGDPMSKALIYPPADAVPRVIVAPAGTPTPDRPHLSLEDVLQPNVGLEELVRRI